MTLFSGEGKGGGHLFEGGCLFRISHSTGVLNRGRALIRGNTVFPHDLSLMNTGSTCIYIL